MTRGVTTLETMVQDLRYETRRSASTNIGQDEYAALKRVLYRTQLFLYWDFDWPFLKVRRDLTMATDQRYYDVPNDLDFERMTMLRGNGNGDWKKIERGITMAREYNIYDSDAGDTAYPVEKYDIIDAGSGEQLEFWPMPDQNGETIRIEGFKQLGSLTSDTDTCTLDDTLIVMFSAAHVLTGQDDRLSKKCLDQANVIYRRQRAGAQRKEGNMFVMGSEVSSLDYHQNPTVIAVKDSS